MTKAFSTTVSSLCRCHLHTTPVVLCLHPVSLTTAFLSSRFRSFYSLASPLLSWVINALYILNSFGSFSLFIALFCITVSAAYSTFIHTIYQWCLVSPSIIAVHKLLVYLNVRVVNSKRWQFASGKTPHVSASLQENTTVHYDLNQHPVSITTILFVSHDCCFPAHYNTNKTICFWTYLKTRIIKSKLFFH